MLIDSISFRYCNHLQFPLDISALVWEVQSQVYSLSFLSGEQINFPLFAESRGLVQVQLCPSSHWTQEDLVEKFGHVHCKDLEYLNCHHTNPLALMYSCTCSSSIHVTIRKLLTSMECLSLFKSHEDVQEQTEIPEGQDRSCNCDPLLTVA